MSYWYCNSCGRKFGSPDISWWDTKTYKCPGCGSKDIEEKKDAAKQIFKDSEKWYCRTCDRYFTEPKRRADGFLGCPRLHKDIEKVK